MQTDAFKASHEQLADQAQAHAVAAAAALWKALEDRNAFDAAIGRRRDPSAAAPYDLRYYRERIESIRGVSGVALGPLGPPDLRMVASR